MLLVDEKSKVSAITKMSSEYLARRKFMFFAQVGYHLKNRVQRLLQITPPALNK